MAKTRSKNPSSPVLRVRELYAFDEQIRSSVVEGLVPDVEGFTPDVEGLVPNVRRPFSKASTVSGGVVSGEGFTTPPRYAKNAENSYRGKNLCGLRDLCGETKRIKTMEIAGFDEVGRGALAGPVVVCCVHIPVASGFMPDVEEERNPCSVGLHARRGTSILDFLAGIDDSKRVSSKRREALFPRITSVSNWGIGYATPSEIDRVGIVLALTLAAQRAYRAMRHPVDLLLLDRGLTLLRDLASERLNHLQPRTPNHPISQSSDHSITQSLNLSISQSSNPPITQSLNHSISRPPALSFTKGDSRSLHIAAASILAKVYRDRMMVKLNAQYPGYGLDSNKGYGTPAHLAALKRLGPSSIHRRSFKVKQ